MTDIIEVPCQNCGKPVKIVVPFVGCVFCDDCTKGQSTEYFNAQSIGTEDFTLKYRQSEIKEAH